MTKEKTKIGKSTMIIAQGACNVIMDYYKKNHDSNVTRVSITGIIFGDEQQQISIKASYNERTETYILDIMSGKNSIQTIKERNNNIPDIGSEVLSESGNLYSVKSKKNYFEGTAVFQKKTGM